MSTHDAGPDATPLRQRRFSVGSVASVVSMLVAVAAIVACRAPWLVVQYDRGGGEMGEATASGLGRLSMLWPSLRGDDLNRYVTTGWLVVAFAVATLVFALRRLSRGNHPAVAWGIVGAGCGILVVAISTIVRIRKVVAEMEPAVFGPIVGGAGAALYLVAGAGLVLIMTGSLAALKR